MSDPHSLEKERPTRRLLLLAGTISLALIIAAAAVGWAAWQMTRAVAKAHAVAAEIQQIFNFTPQIRVNQTVIVTQTTPVLDLVTLQKQSLVRRSWSDTWLHSTKTFVVEATFTARAGFHLNDSFHIEINSHTQQISVQLPPAKILSVDMSDIHILQDESGLWNGITADDREQVLRELDIQARQEFGASSILADARAEGERRIRQLLQNQGNVSFAPAPEKP